MFLFDIAPSHSGGAALGVFIAIAFFFIALASGIFAFIMLRKTLKMAFRMVIVAAVLLIAVFGSIALWLFLQPSTPTRPTPNRPPANRSR
jgi:low temperature requirement protein LtrA